jgi:hypothetical protein
MGGILLKMPYWSLRILRPPSYLAVLIKDYPNV